MEVVGGDFVGAIVHGKNNRQGREGRLDCTYIYSESWIKRKVCVRKTLELEKIKKENSIGVSTTLKDHI